LQEPRVLRVTGESIRKKDVRTLLQAAHTPGTIVIGTQILSRLYDLRVKRLVLMGQEEFLRVAGYRAHETVFQTFRNLIDALRPAEVLVVADQKSLIGAQQLANDEAFCEEELAKQRQADFPPYTRLFLSEAQEKRKTSGPRRRIDEVLDRLQAEGLGSRILGPLLHKRGGVHWRVVLKGEASSVPPVLLRIYGLPGVRIE
jgi:primosomal protein N'